MVRASLVERYIGLEQWVQNLSPARNAFLHGLMWAVMWTTLTAVFGSQSILRAVGIGVAGGIFYGWLCYSWGLSS